MVAILINEFLKVTVKSSGAELISIKNTLANKEYLWQGSPDYWARRAPILFPIVGKLKDNKYKIDGSSFEMPQHGFARDMMFETIDQQNTSLTFVLNSNKETLKSYPFNFALTVKYSLNKNKVMVTYNVENTDEKTLFFSIGAHPAFICPLENHEKISDYFIEFEKPEKISRAVLKDGLLTNEQESFLENESKFQLHETIFDKDAIICKELKSSKVSLKSLKSNHRITLDYSGFPYLAFWSKSPAAPFICLEPWYGLADNINSSGDFISKEGIMSLAKGKSFECSYSIEISNKK